MRDATVVYYWIMRTKPTKPIKPLPHGEYRGTWGGYLARIERDDLTYEFKTDIGIRTPNAPCIVTVAADGITVRVADREGE